MPSSNKTTYLELNNWVGTDKPKRDDFNQDNQKIDAKLQQFNTTLSAQSNSINIQSALIDALTSDIDTLEQAANGQMTIISAMQTDSSVQANNLSAHTESGGIHVTPAEKNKLTSFAAPEIYTYTGNGNMTNRQYPGFKPKFGFIFAVARPVVEVNINAGMYEINTAFLSEDGSCDGVTLNSDGFTVNHSGVPGSDGYTLRLNRNNVKYICLLWK